ncbi:excinuclease ABC subunit UvrC [Candidatus Dependentiae bacterium]|nr:excinuclease ABC subunit UvrC [Candidatus Dependentiae bacterium]
MNTSIAESLKLLPNSPGVYFFRNENNKIIYIGKAKSLKNRVKSYFKENIKDYKTNFLVKHIDSIDFIITNNENEAIILENVLIKKHQPKYNIDLKDDKTFPYIKINLTKRFPRIIITRKPGKKLPHIRLFGPFPAAISKDVIRYLEDIYKLKRCRKSIEKIDRACIYFNMGKCSGMCIGAISEEEYKESINEVILILKGKSKNVISDLKKKMFLLSEEQDFEEAAVIRDRIQNIKHIQTKQLMLIPGDTDYDIINFYTKEQFISFDVFSFRQGKLLTKMNHVYDNKAGFPEKELLEEFLFRYYQMENINIPPIIQIPIVIPGKKKIIEFLTGRINKRVKIKIPKKGKYKRLLDLVKENSAVNLYKKVVQEHKVGLIILKDVLKLPKIPRIIECFDISNLGDFFAVASEVRFIDAYPDKKNYRHFKIKTVDHQDDFQMIEEVVFRRYSRLLKEKRDLPDIVMIDGGPGQLSSAKKSLNNLGLESLFIISLAKKDELIFSPGKKAPLVLQKSSPALKLLQRIRDEAHRFAITYHKKLRRKSSLKSIFNEIPGIGPKKTKALLKKFKDIKKIADADIDEITEIKGINKDLAKLIKKYIKSIHC